MTLRMNITTSRFGTATSYELADNLVTNVRLTKTYDAASRLSFTMRADNLSYPLDYETFVTFWDDAEGSASDPQFEGWVETINPGDDSTSVHVTCLDPTARAQQEATVHSTSWGAGDVSLGTRPQPASSSVPRIVFNVKIDNDDDYAFERAHDLTVGEIIETLLEDQYHPLYWANAAPGDGTDNGNDYAYEEQQSGSTGGASGSGFEGADLAQMQHRPQEKIVFESEGITSAIKRLVNSYAPDHRVYWKPGDRKWRFHRITDSTAVNIAINDHDAEYPLLTLNIDRTIQGRAGAVKIFGPETLTSAEFSTSDGSLTPIGNVETLEFVGAVPIQAYNQWQITDPQKRRGGRLLPDWYVVNVGNYRWVPVRSPVLLVSYDNGRTFAGALGAVFDFQSGTVTFPGGAYPYFYTSAGIVVTTGTQRYFPPNVVKLIWAYCDTPLSVRVPASGFEGTAYSEHDLETVLERYDEALAVGYERGQPVTTAVREAQFKTLARSILNDRKDVIYTGAAFIEGIDYRWQHLERRVNFTGLNGDGGSVTTGLEAINAIVTEVEYDYEEQTTSVAFSTDKLALVGRNIESLKEQLRINALEAREQYQVFLDFRGNQNWRGDRFQELAGVTVLSDTIYVDPETGFAQGGGFNNAT